MIGHLVTAVIRHISREMCLSKNTTVAINTLKPLVNASSIDDKSNRIVFIYCFFFVACRRKNQELVLSFYLSIIFPSNLN